MGVSHADEWDEGDPGRPNPFRMPASAHDEPPTTPMVAGAVGDRCANCNAPLASDQRYCLQCGQRRGKSRFTPATMSAPAAGPSTVVALPAGAAPRRTPPGATLIAGIATLILAMGVGVVIGRSNTSTPTSSRAAAPTVITVGGGGAAAGTTNAAAAPTSGGKPAKAAPKNEAAKAKKAASASKPTAAAVQKASNAAQSVLGGSGAKQTPTVSQGQSCTPGSAGCTGGKFTGTFFGN